MAKTAVAALWWVVAVAVAMAMAMAVAVAVVVAMTMTMAMAVVVAVAVVVELAVARVSPPFSCAPALALLPIPFFKSSNRWDRGGMRGGPS